MKPMQKMPIGSAKYHRPMASTTPVTHAHAVSYAD